MVGVDIIIRNVHSSIDRWSNKESPCRILVPRRREKWLAEKTPEHTGRSKRSSFGICRGVEKTTTSSQYIVGCSALWYTWPHRFRSRCSCSICSAVELDGSLEYIECPMSPSLATCKTMETHAMSMTTSMAAL